jgi:hypothetical protein
MTTEKWTDAQNAITTIEEDPSWASNRMIDPDLIEGLPNFDRALSECGHHIDRIIFKDGTSLILINQRWRIDESWPSLEEKKAAERPVNWYYRLGDLDRGEEFPPEPVPGREGVYFPHIRLNCYGCYVITVVGVERGAFASRLPEKVFATQLEAGDYLDKEYPYPPIDLALQDKLMVELLGSDKEGGW